MRSLGLVYFTENNPTPYSFIIHILINFCHSVFETEEDHKEEERSSAATSAPQGSCVTTSVTPSATRHLKQLLLFLCLV